MKNTTNTCCFIGHRKIFESEELKKELYEIIETLILEENIDTFLLGSKSEFNTLCHKTLTELKEKYPHIKRIFVRAEYPYITEQYTNYLLKSYEDTYFPEKIIDAGKAVYVERNYEMINNSRICVFYHDKLIHYPNRKSGTEIALKYAKKQSKEIIIVPHYDDSILQEIKSIITT